MYTTALDVVSRTDDRDIQYFGLVGLACISSCIWVCNSMYSPDCKTKYSTMSKPYYHS
ncbi:hypothetical protein BYT27DRAFT_7205987 [Phlegmacium glaucopus]|nr:hypothetical protein BYT27DRAFT_7205987 [Phlegmacium glaucopus]